MLREFQNAKNWQMRQSAARLLGRVGGEKSLAVLVGTNPGSDPELKLILEKSIASIKGRR